MPPIPTPGLDEDRPNVKANIGKHIARIKKGSVEKMYLNQRVSSAAKKFLKDTNLYDTEGGRWVEFLPSMTRDELRTATLNILTAIYHNVGSKAQQKARHIVDTHNMSLPHSHDHDEQGNVHSSPDIVITGEVRDGREGAKP